MGLGAGLSYASANSALAYARYPERAFSIVTISWMLAGAAMLTLGPMLHDAWPHEGIYLGMATAELLCIAFILRLPDARRLPKRDSVTDDQPGIVHHGVRRGEHRILLPQPAAVGAGRRTRYPIRSAGGDRSCWSRSTRASASPPGCAC